MNLENWGDYSYFYGEKHDRCFYTTLGAIIIKKEETKN